MRAIGARMGFVRSMIGAETVTLAFVFGSVGVVLGLVLLFILGATGIRASNAFLRILFGGERCARSGHGSRATPLRTR